MCIEFIYTVALIHFWINKYNGSHAVCATIQFQLNFRNAFKIKKYTMRLTFFYIANQQSSGFEQSNHIILIVEGMSTRPRENVRSSTTRKKCLRFMNSSEMWVHFSGRESRPQSKTVIYMLFLCVCMKVQILTHTFFHFVWKMQLRAAYSHFFIEHIQFPFHCAHTHQYVLIEM